MERQSVIEAFKNIKSNGYNFRIVTNVAQGHGINGTSFHTFDADYVDTARNEYEKDKFFVITSVHLKQHHVEIHYTSTLKTYFNDGAHVVYIGYESIVEVDVLIASARKSAWAEKSNTSIYFIKYEDEE